MLALGRAGAGEQFEFATVTAWKLLATGSVLWICWTGGRSVMAFQTLTVGLFGWLLSDRLWAVPPADSTPVISAAATIGLWILPLVAFRPHRKQLLQLRLQPSAVLLPLALAAAVPLVTYAVRQGEQATDPSGTTAPYAMTALAVVLATQAVFAALRPAGSSSPTRLVALAAIWVGLAAVIRPTDPGSFGTAWGAALIGWAALFLAADQLELQRTHRRRSPTAADTAITG